MEQIVTSFGQSLPTITAGIVLAVLGWAVPKLSKIFKTIGNFRAEHSKLLELESDSGDVHAELSRRIDQYKEDEIIKFDEYTKIQDKKFEQYQKENQKELKEYQLKRHAEFDAYKTHMDKIIKEIESYQKLFNDSQRTQIKWQIVDIYQKAKIKGFITPMELDTVNRLRDSYTSLDGNTYIEAVVNRCNTELEVSGEPIPEH